MGQLSCVFATHRTHFNSRVGVDLGDRRTPYSKKVGSGSGSGSGSSGSKDHDERGPAIVFSELFDHTMVDSVGDDAVEDASLSCANGTFSFDDMVRFIRPFHS